MIRILLVESDPLVGFVAAEAFQYAMQSEVQSVLTSWQAIQRLETTSFDLAFISIMQDYSGLVVAESAVNHNVAVLLTSGSPIGQSELQRFDYPCLLKPYSLKSLLLQTKHIIDDGAENIRRVKACATWMKAYRNTRSPIVRYQNGL